MSRQQELFDSFWRTRIDRAIDIDGVWGAQCVDTAKDWMQYVGFSGALQALGGDGFAHQYYYRGDALGLTSFFTQVFDNFQPGDLMIYREYPVYTPLSHVGLYFENCGGGWHNCFSQNQGGINGAANIVTLPDAAILCGYRLKEEPQWTADAEVNPGSLVKCPTDYVQAIDFKNNTVYLQLMEAWIPIDLLGFGKLTVKARNAWVQKADFTTVDGKLGVGPDNARQGTAEWKVSASNLTVAGIDMKAHKLYFSDTGSWLPWDMVGTDTFQIYGNCWMAETTCEDTNVAENKIKVHGLWVNPAPFQVKI